jgi:hypothetical protein
MHPLLIAQKTPYLFFSGNIFEKDDVLENSGVDYI